MYRCLSCRHAFSDNSLAYDEGTLKCPECKGEDVAEIREDWEQVIEEMRMDE